MKALDLTKVESNVKQKKNGSKTSRLSDRANGANSPKFSMKTARSLSKSADVVQFIDDNVYFAFKLTNANLFTNELDENQITLFKKILRETSATIPKYDLISTKFNMNFPENDYLIFKAPFSKLFDLYRLLKHLGICRILDIETQTKITNGTDTLILLPLATAPLPEVI